MKQDYRNYNLQPLIFSAEIARKRGFISYLKNGVIVLQSDRLISFLGKKVVRIPLKNQFSIVRATFNDLNKAISALSNSPLMLESKTLRQLYDEELNKFEELTIEAADRGDWEAEYGTYVYDQVTGNLYLIAPMFWHRLALVTSPAKLLYDFEQKMSWNEIRSLLADKVVGFVGASVGGGILESWLREARPLQTKIADCDWLDTTNLSRAERGSIRFLVGSKDKRENIRDPYDIPRVNKAEYLAYEYNMLDPYANFFVYSNGLNLENIDQFLVGDRQNEPRIDILVEEVDDMQLKIDLRLKCQEYGIPVLMMSDFGYQIQCQFQDFSKNKNLSIGYKKSTNEVLEIFEAGLKTKNREDRFKVIEAFCGPEFEKDGFGRWVRGEGEQPTSSLPQSGATAMVSGGIGGHILAKYFLGYKIPARFIYDMFNNKLFVDKD